MKRSRFLAALAVLPFAPRILTEPRLTGILPVEVFENGMGTTLKDIIEHWSGGIRPRAAYLDRFAQTDDAISYEVVAQHPDGRWFTKPIVTSGLFLAVTKDNPIAATREKAYQVFKKAREMARDWAYLEWGADWRRHVPTSPSWWSV